MNDTNRRFRPADDVLQVDSPPLGIIAFAVQAARRSPCHKDQRGAVVWHPRSYASLPYPYSHVAASNGPPTPFSCDGSDACRTACGRLAVHVLHVRTINGEPVPSGPPSCTTCSRTLLEVGVGAIWLLHAEGWRAYTAAGFHELSLQHEKNRLPVIRS